MSKYTVKPGDTLWGIAQKSGVSVDDLVKTNGISNPNLIKPGQTIQVGSAAKAVATATAAANAASSGTTNNRTQTGAPIIDPLPTLKGYDTTTFDSTGKGAAAYQAYLDAQAALNGQNPFTFSQDERLKKVNEAIENYGKFSYDLNEDAFYQQFADKYIQQAKLAMADTMGQTAALTGGYGNSYAQSVGQQAYNEQLDKLNDIAPQLYQMALERYKMGKEDLYNQHGLLMNEYTREYGEHQDEYAKLMDALGLARSDYYDGADTFYTEQNNKNSVTGMENDDAMAIWGTNADQAWKNAEWDEAIRQYEKGEEWKQKEWDFQTSPAAKSSSGGGGGGVTYTNTLWNPTGTFDNSGNPVFINSEGKTQSFGQGVNPYTGTKHPDAKNGTFSNGYQPNNIGGTKLKNSGMSTNVTGKNQTIWEANGKYWLWRGDLNKYIEVDVSDLD